MPVTVTGSKTLRRCRGAAGPSCPSSLCPQQRTVPSPWSTHACEAPTAICRAPSTLRAVLGDVYVFARLNAWSCQHDTSPERSSAQVVSPPDASCMASPGSMVAGAVTSASALEGMRQHDTALLLRSAQQCHAPHARRCASSRPSILRGASGVFAMAEPQHHTDRSARIAHDCEHPEERSGVGAGAAVGVDARGGGVTMARARRRGRSRVAEARRSCTRAT